MKSTSVFNRVTSFVVVILFSCNSGQQEKIPIASVDTISIPEKPLEESWDGLRETIAFLDSNLKYGRLAKEMEIKMAKAEADYYRTADKKYYNLYYKYQKQQWRYVGLANRYDDSLKAKH